MKRDAGGTGSGGICLTARTDKQKSRESVLANLVVFAALIGVIRASKYI